jgi:transposase
MEHIQGSNRNQIRMTCLEDYIEAENPVRVIDCFVNRLSLEQLGFEHVILKQEGRPAFNPAALLKLYLYGYNGSVRIRSSRRLEAECKRNIELRWLMEELYPSHATIASFRKEHPKELKEVFKLFTAFLYKEGLLHEKVVAIDGTKIRAQNNGKNNYSEKSIEEHLTYVKNKTEDYLKELDEMDKQESAEQDNGMRINREQVREKLKRLQQSKEKYSTLKELLVQSEQKQVSTTDADSRMLQTRLNQTEVGYNIQCAAEAKNKLIVAFDVTNTNDYNALHAMAMQAKASLQTDELTAITDGGYYNGKQISDCEKDNITTFVAPKDYILPTAVPDERYSYDKFKYDEQKDCYVCPEGQELTTDGSRQKRTKGAGKDRYEVTFKRYNTRACENCPVKHLCTNSKKGRELHRYDYHDAVERNNKRVKEHPDVYTTRQCIVEHPFGTAKRNWGYTYTLLRGMHRVAGEVALIFLSYNLRRTMSIMGVSKLIKALKEWKMPQVA